MDREKILVMDPYMLVSWTNMKLRDVYDDVYELCDDIGIEYDEITERLKNIGYMYSESTNQFTYTNI